LWNQESGWSNTARNKSSGAYGIPQALPPSKMGAAANPPQSSYIAQINWGLGYIKNRPGYGSPAAAWAHEVAHGWYGGGLTNGLFTRPTLIGVGERGPERVNVAPAGSGSGASLDDIAGLLSVLIDAVHGVAPNTAAGVAGALGGAGRRAVRDALYSAR
jgi:hypothetical protein